MVVLSVGIPHNLLSLMKTNKIDPVPVHYFDLLVRVHQVLIAPFSKLSFERIIIILITGHVSGHIESYLHTIFIIQTKHTSRPKQM